jgi:hypothetical protein
MFAPRYRGEPRDLAVLGRTVAALVAMPADPNGTYPYPRRQIVLSTDAGVRWRTVASPCPDAEATGIALDGRARPMVVCQWDVASGALASKAMWVATDSSAQQWVKVVLPATGSNVGVSMAAGGTGVLWGARTPPLLTADGGGAWTPNQIADGDARIATYGSALPNGLVTLLVWDPDRQAVLLLRTADHGASWTELAAFAK